MLVYQGVNTVHCSFGSWGPGVGQVVACVSVNDAFVMKAWGQQQKALNERFFLWCVKPQRSRKFKEYSGF